MAAVFAGSAVMTRLVSSSYQAASQSTLTSRYNWAICVELGTDEPDLGVVLGEPAIGRRALDDGGHDASWLKAERSGRTPQIAP